jgi:sigma-E factor negative regulatory protein RseA
MMKNKLSALVDGELTRDELEQVCAALDDAEMRGDWADFVLVGAALRGEGQLNFDVSSRVMAALAEEPTVLAPRMIDIPVIAPTIAVARQRNGAWGRQWTALAAGMAGVGLVAWVAFSLAPPEPEVQIATMTAPLAAEIVTSVTSAATTSPGALKPVLEQRNHVAQVQSAPSSKDATAFQDYLVAHQVYVSGGPISGGSRNVRAVSLSRDGR